MDSNGTQKLAKNNGSRRNEDARAVVVDIRAPLRPEGRQHVETELLTEQLQRTTEALEAARAEVRALSANLLIAREEERRRIARELHDDLSQRTALVEFELDHVAQLVREPGLTESLSAAREGLAKLARAIRDISHQLHPSIVTDLGLPAALKQLVNEFNESGGSAILTGRIAAPMFDPLVGTALYRIAQEALRNVRKHAGAVPVRVRLRTSVSDIYLSIKDSGPGFAVEASYGDRGLGLLGMRERARLIGATLMIRSLPGEGTQIVVRARRSESADTGPHKNPDKH